MDLTHVGWVCAYAMANVHPHDPPNIVSHGLVLLLPLVVAIDSESSSSLSEEEEEGRMIRRNRSISSTNNSNVLYRTSPTGMLRPHPRWSNNTTVSYNSGSKKRA